jgi:hypothetical protein
MTENHFEDESGIIKEDPEIACLGRQASFFGMTLILKKYMVVLRTTELSIEA